MILCHVTRRVSEERILSQASAVGLVLESKRQLEGPIGCSYSGDSRVQMCTL